MRFVDWRGDVQVGRPRIFDDPNEMLKLGNAYFEQCRISEEPILITGLALALGLASRDSLSDYGRREEFSSTVKALKMVCENFAERRIYGNNPTGAIFALKNYGWIDKQQVESSGIDGAPIQSEVVVKFVKTGASE
jgi:hypothetical protein